MQGKHKYFTQTGLVFKHTCNNDHEMGEQKVSWKMERNRRKPCLLMCTVHVSFHLQEEQMYELQCSTT